MDRRSFLKGAAAAAAVAPIAGPAAFAPSAAANSIDITIYGSIAVRSDGSVFLLGGAKYLLDHIRENRHGN